MLIFEKHVVNRCISGGMETSLGKVPGSESQGPLEGLA